MKILKRVLFGAFLFLLMILSAGCLNNTFHPELTPFKPTISMTPTILDKSPTVTKVFNTLTPTLTAIPHSTLSKEAKEELILRLMTTDGDCSLPCWWGVTPGKTTWSETKNLLESEGFTIVESSRDNGLNIYSIKGGLDLPRSQANIHADFGGLHGILNNIILRVGGSDEGQFRSIFRNYSVQKVLTVYGKPSRIMLQSHAQFDSRSDFIGYGLWLFYDHLGFLLVYGGRTTYGEIYHICPTLDNGGNVDIIDIYLTSPNNSVHLDNLSDYSHYKNGYIYPIEDIGMSIDNFYISFSKSTSACLNVPSDKYNNP